MRIIKYLLKIFLWVLIAAVAGYFVYTFVRL